MPTTAAAIREDDSYSEHDHQSYGDGDASYFHFVGDDPGTSGDTTGDDQAAGGGGGDEDDAGDDEGEERLPEFVFYGVGGGGGGGGGKEDRESDFGRHLRLRIRRVPPPVIKTKRCCDQ